VPGAVIPGFIPGAIGFCIIGKPAIAAADVGAFDEPVEPVVEFAPAVA
jgi:hypothetical protein